MKESQYIKVENCNNETLSFVVGSEGNLRLELGFIYHQGYVERTLTREQVKDLLPHLLNFVVEGEL